MTTKRKRPSRVSDFLNKRGRPNKPGTTPELCGVLDCGRPFYARGLCQTHHRQLLTTGRIRAIRPYRKRDPDTVKFAGLRLSRHCAAMLEQVAKSKGIAHGAVIAEVLEEWRSELRQRGGGDLDGERSAGHPETSARRTRDKAGEGS